MRRLLGNRIIKLPPIESFSLEALIDKDHQERQALLDYLYKVVNIHSRYKYLRVGGMFNSETLYYQDFTHDVFVLTVDRLNQIYNYNKKRGITTVPTKHLRIFVTQRFNEIIRSIFSFNRSMFDKSLLKNHKIKHYFDTNEEGVEQIEFLSDRNIVSPDFYLTHPEALVKRYDLTDYANPFRLNVKRKTTSKPLRVTIFTHNYPLYFRTSSEASDVLGIDVSHFSKVASGKVSKTKVIKEIEILNGN